MKSFDELSEGILRNTFKRNKNVNWSRYEAKDEMCIPYRFHEQLWDFLSQELKDDIGWRSNTVGLDRETGIALKLFKKIYVKKALMQESKLSVDEPVFQDLINRRNKAGKEDREFYDFIIKYLQFEWSALGNND